MGTDTTKASLLSSECVEYVTRIIEVDRREIFVGNDVSLDDFRQWLKDRGRIEDWEVLNAEETLGNEDGFWWAEAMKNWEAPLAELADTETTPLFWINDRTVAGRYTVYLSPELVTPLAQLRVLLVASFVIRTAEQIHAFGCSPFELMNVAFWYAQELLSEDPLRAVRPEPSVRMRQMALSWEGFAMIKASGPKGCRRIEECISANGPQLSNLIIDEIFNCDLREGAEVISRREVGDTCYWFWAYNPGGDILFVLFRPLIPER